VNGPTDVLEQFFAEVLESDFEATVDLTVDRRGDADSADIGQLLHPCSDIDSFPVDVAVLEDDIAEIDADAKFHASIIGHIGIATAHSVLYLDRTPDRVSDALELDQHAVSGRLNDMTLIFGDRRIDQLDAMSTKSRKRTSFIQLH
jgi:hypothetical protein